LGKALSFELGRRVHADHAALIDFSLERLERTPRLRKALGHVEAVEQNGVVARKIIPVVLEYAKLVALDLGVGRVDVHDIDPAGGDRFVGEAVVEARGVSYGIRYAAFSPGQPSPRPMNSCDSPS